MDKINLKIQTVKINSFLWMLITLDQVYLIDLRENFKVRLGRN